LIIQTSPVLAKSFETVAKNEGWGWTKIGMDCVVTTENVKAFFK
jgi:hypothetical protein